MRPQPLETRCSCALGFRGFRPAPVLILPVVLFLTVVLFLPYKAFSAGEDVELRELREKVQKIEKTQAELYHSLKEKKAASRISGIGERISYGALVEVEASVDDNEKTGDTSDVVLATVQLGFDAQVNKHVVGHILLLWEEDTTDPVAMDEGTITITSPSGFNMTVGKMYLPFGVFNSHFISDPEVLELGETNESALKAGYTRGPFEASLGVFNGAVHKTGDNDGIDDFFLAVTVTPVEWLSGGAYYITDIGDSDGMAGLLSSPLAKVVAGYGGFVSIKVSDLVIDAEYVTSSGAFDVVDLDKDIDGNGDKPAAYNVELNYPIGGSIEAAFRFEGNKDFFDFPKTQYGAALSYGLYENVVVAVELLRGKFSDDTERTLITTQLGVEF